MNRNKGKCEIYNATNGILLYYSVLSDSNHKILNILLIDRRSCLPAEKKSSASCQFNEGSLLTDQAGLREQASAGYTTAYNPNWKQHAPT